MQYDECLRTAMVLKFLEYISYIKIKRSGPSSGSLHEKKCFLFSVTSVCPELLGQIVEWMEDCTFFTYPFSRGSLHTPSFFGLRKKWTKREINGSINGFIHWNTKTDLENWSINASFTDSVYWLITITLIHNLYSYLNEIKSFP